jgi:hypothetical protein
MITSSPRTQGRRGSLAVEIDAGPLRVNHPFPVRSQKNIADRMQRRIRIIEITVCKSGSAHKNNALTASIRRIRILQQTLFELLGVGSRGPFQPVDALMGLAVAPLDRPV